MVVTSVMVGVTIVAEPECFKSLALWSNTIGGARFRFLLEFLTVSFPAPQSGGLTSLENLMSGSIDFSHHISIVDRKSRLRRILCAYCCKFSLYSCIGLLCVPIFALTFYSDFISVFIVHFSLGHLHLGQWPFIAS